MSLSPQPSSLGSCLSLDREELQIAVRDSSYLKVENVQSMPVLHCTYLALVKVKGVLTGPLLRRMLVVRYLVTKSNKLISKERQEAK